MRENLKFAGFLLLMALIAMALPVVARAATWKPGTPTYASEKKAAEMLEQKADHAYCRGIRRFGHHGEFPYEYYVVFDCSISLDEERCSNMRWRAVKGWKRNTFILKRVRWGNCY